MFDRFLGKAEKTEWWTDGLATLAISSLVWTFVEKGFLRAPMLLAVLVAALVCLLLLRVPGLRTLIGYAALVLFAVDMLLSGGAKAVALLGVVGLVFIVRLFVFKVFGWR